MDEMFFLILKAILTSPHTHCPSSLLWSPGAPGVEVGPEKLGGKPRDGKGGRKMVQLRKLASGWTGREENGPATETSLGMDREG